MLLRQVYKKLSQAQVAWRGQCAGGGHTCRLAALLLRQQWLCLSCGCRLNCGGRFQAHRQPRELAAGKAQVDVASGLRPLQCKRYILLDAPCSSSCIGVDAL